MPLVSRPLETSLHLPVRVSSVIDFALSLIVLLGTGHDSSITIVYPGAPAVICIKGTTLPYLTLTWTTEDSLVAAGYDCQPMLFQGSETTGWKAVGSLDDTTAPKSSGGSSLGGRSPIVGRLNSAAFNTFRNADSKGQSSLTGMPGAGSGGESELMTVHQNTISTIREHEGSRGQVTKVSTSGVDGKLVIWSVNAAGALAGRMSGLRM